MSIKNIFKNISNIAKEYRINRPYVVGGLPRDIYLKKEIKTRDIDITTNNPDVMQLGILSADFLNSPFELSDDGHMTVYYDSYDLDFSSHFISEAVEEYLDGDYKGFEEAFSRDFTINALHLDLSTDSFFDPTGMAVDDIKNKIIRTPVPAPITLNDDPRRIYRAINFAARYGFAIEDSIKEFVKDNTDLFGSENIKDKYITLKINSAIKNNKDTTISLLRELDLFKLVPLSGDFKELLIEEKMLADYLSNNILD